MRAARRAYGVSRTRARDSQEERAIASPMAAPTEASTSMAFGPKVARAQGMATATAAPAQPHDAGLELDEVLALFALQAYAHRRTQCLAIGFARNGRGQPGAKIHRQFRRHQRAGQRGIERSLIIHGPVSSHSRASNNPRCRSSSVSAPRARNSVVFTVPSGWPSCLATSLTERSSK